MLEPFRNQPPAPNKRIAVSSQTNPARNAGICAVNKTTISAARTMVRCFIEENALHF